MPCFCGAGRRVMAVGPILALGFRLRARRRDMAKCCTVCGKKLSLWDHVRGRFDHPNCWQGSVSKLFADDCPAAFSKFRQFALARVSNSLAPEYILARTRNYK